MDVAETVTYDDDDRELEADLANGGAAKGEQKGLLTGLLSSLKTNIVGKEALSSTDVAAAVTVLQKRLQERNVSSEVASQVRCDALPSKLSACHAPAAAMPARASTRTRKQRTGRECLQVCASVSATLEGKKLASFTGVASLVRSAMEGAITRILSPKRSIDVLAAIRASQARGMPYSIVFVGVNGVGKSTNLAKIAYWLRQQDLRVMIAACDTFRCVALGARPNSLLSWNTVAPQSTSRNVCSTFCFHQQSRCSFTASSDAAQRHTGLAQWSS